MKALLQDKGGVQLAPRNVPPVQPDQLNDPIQERAYLDEFLTIIMETFQATFAMYLEDLNAFTPHPRESLLGGPLQRGGDISPQSGTDDVP